MPEAYDLHEGRFFQETAAVSAVAGLYAYIGATPAEKIRTIFQAAYFVDIAETKIVHFSIVSRTGQAFPVTIPASIALGPTRGLPLLTEGMELKLFPGEYLRIDRDSATAGSTMLLYVKFLETELPFTIYKEKQSEIVKVKRRHGTVYMSSGGISEGGIPAGERAGHIVEGERGGRGESEPI